MGKLVIALIVTEGVRISPIVSINSVPVSLSAFLLPVFFFIPDCLDFKPSSFPYWFFNRAGVFAQILVLCCVIVILYEAVLFLRNPDIRSYIR